jgi:transglutaminase-like putative cysteine protease
MKNKLLIIACLVFLSFSNLNAQYNYNLIPDSLKKNADYIIIEDYQEFKVVNEGEATEHIKFAVVVNNKYANRYEHIAIGYNKNLKLKNFSAEIYDAAGNRVKKLKNEVIEDVSAISGYSLYEDNRQKILHFNYNRYPFIIIYEYERTKKGLLNYPSWSFQSYFNTSVLSSKLDFIIPDGMEFKYKEYNLKNKVKVSGVKGGKLYSWEETMLVAKKHQELLPPSQYFLPILKLAPMSFKMDEYEGSLKSWNDFAKWNYELNKGRDIIPVETYEQIKKLVKDARTDIEKAKILYEYMQNKTRYVSVQLGIGGFQTFPAEYVDKNGYGDCKALTNYMYTLLEKVGVKSNYVLVSAGEDTPDIITDFPSNQFNHVILCIPQENDTIWLECTSQKQPFGFLGSFTDDRHVLIVGEDGGALAKTEQYGKEINKRVRTAAIIVDKEGCAKINMKTIFNGLLFENRYGIEEYSFKDQKKVLNKIYVVPGMEIKLVKYYLNKNRIPSITEFIEMDVSKFASISSKRMFMKLNLFSGTVNVPEKNDDRTLPFEIKRGYTVIDSIHIQIPEGYKVEALPPEKSYNTKFGMYYRKISVNEHDILYVRKLITEKGFFPASDYSDFYNIRKKIKKADKAKLVLVKE